MVRAGAALNRPASPRLWLGLLLTVARHIAIIGMFAQLRPLHDGAPHQARNAIAWLLPMPEPTQQQPLRRPVVQPAAPAAARRQRPSEMAAPAPAGEVPPITPPAAVIDTINTIDTFAAPVAPQTPSASAVMAQARKDLGKIDQELRQAYPERPPRRRTIANKPDWNAASTPRTTRCRPNGSKRRGPWRSRRPMPTRTCTA